jgi:hypothetical protein
MKRRVNVCGMWGGYDDRIVGCDCELDCISTNIIIIIKYLLVNFLPLHERPLFQHPSNHKFHKIVECSTHERKNVIEAAGCCAVMED